MLTSEERDAIWEEMHVILEHGVIGIVGNDNLYTILDKYTESDVCKLCVSYRTCRDEKTEKCEYYIEKPEN